MQLKSKQFFEKVKVPQFQFLDRVPDIPVVPQKGDSTVQFLNKVLVPMVQTMQCSCVYRQGRRHPSFRKQWRVPQIQSSTE